MRKLIIRFLIFLSLSINMFITPVSAVNIFKEGVYKAADFNFSPNNTYSIQNVSQINSVNVLLFDENQVGIQSIKLNPKSSKYTLLPLMPNYRIVIVGNGEVFIE